MKKEILSIFMGMGLMLGVSGNSNAALLTRSGGMIYDTDRNLTWLQNANMADTAGNYGDGRVTWSVANAWANNLVYGGFSDWRLPTALNVNLLSTCVGYNCTGSEMGHLYYTELGNVSNSFTKPGPFVNMKPSYYWLGTEYYNSYTGYAWDFNISTGYQNIAAKTASMYAWAVRDGDTATVPEPSTMLLIGSGLISLIVCGRKMNR